MQFAFDRHSCTLSGKIEVPVFGTKKIDYRMVLENSADHKGIVVKDYDVKTDSGMIRSRLGRLEPYLRDINQDFKDMDNKILLQFLI